MVAAFRVLTLVPQAQGSAQLSWGLSPCGPAAGPRTLLSRLISMMKH